MQQSSICLYLLFLLEMIVHQHIITLDDVKTFFINRKAGQLLTGQPGTQNDETFQQQAEHFSLQVIPQNVFGNHSVHHLVQQFGVGYREPQMHYTGSSAKQHSAARHFFLMLVNAVKILVEKKSKIPARYILELRAVKITHRDDFILLHLYFHMVYYQCQFAFLDPYKLIQTTIVTDDPVCVKRFSQYHRFLQRCIVCVIHHG